METVETTGIITRYYKLHYLQFTICRIVPVDCSLTFSRSQRVLVIQRQTKKLFAAGSGRVHSLRLEGSQLLVPTELHEFSPHQNYWFSTLTAKFKQTNYATIHFRNLKTAVGEVNLICVIMRVLLLWRLSSLSIQHFK